jgi:hypothetical protein
MTDTDRLFSRPACTLTDEERAAAENNWAVIEASILAALAHCEQKNELMLDVIARVKP